MRLVVADGKVTRVQRVRRKSLAGQLVLVLVGLQVLFLCSFVSLELPTGTGHNLEKVFHAQAQRVCLSMPERWQAEIRHYYPHVYEPVTKIRFDAYTPQAPVAIFLGYALGWPIAPIAAALFLFLGTVGPFFGVYLFANGGGPEYYTQPGFGYLIGMVVAAGLAALITRDSRKSLRQLTALVAGIVGLHLVGLLYLFAAFLIFALTEPNGGPTWLPWVFEQARNLSWYQLPYDAIFGIVLIGLGFPLRSIVSLLTSPDIGLKSKADILAQQSIDKLLH